MLLTEWDWDKYVEIQRREAVEEGWEKGREEGWEKGREEGWEKGREEIARNALARGFSREAVSDITGLDIDAIRQLSAF